MKYVYPHVQWNWLDSGVCVLCGGSYAFQNAIVKSILLLFGIVPLLRESFTLMHARIRYTPLKSLIVICQCCRWYATPFRSISFPSTYTILIPESQGSEWNVLSLRDARTRFAFPPRNIQSRRQKTMFSFSVWKLNFNDNAIKFCNCASSIYFNDFRLIFKHTASSVCRFARFSTFWSCRI